MLPSIDVALRYRLAFWARLVAPQAPHLGEPKRVCSECGEMPLEPEEECICEACINRRVGEGD